MGPGESGEDAYTLQGSFPVSLCDFEVKEFATPKQLMEFSKNVLLPPRNLKHFSPLCDLMYNDNIHVSTLHVLKKLLNLYKTKGQAGWGVYIPLVLFLALSQIN